MTYLGPTNTRKEDINTLAGKQYGYFTAKQAMKVGYTKELHSYHVAQNNWMKISTALYRLPGYTDSMKSDFTRWSLWSRNQKDQPQGVISHNSAMALYGVEEYSSSEVHMTVAGRFQKKIPPEIVIHKASLNLSAIEHHGCFMVTCLRQTLLDMRSELQANGEWDALMDKVAVSGRLSPEEIRSLSLPANKNAVKIEIQSNQEGALDPVSEGVWKMIFDRTEAGRKRSRAGFTLVELLVVVAIISILAGMLLPALNTALVSARGIACANNIKQVHLTNELYAADNDSMIPAGLTAGTYTPYWHHSLKAVGVVDENTFICPEMPRADFNFSWYPHIGINYGLYKKCVNGLWTGSEYAPINLTGIQKPSIKLFLLDLWRNRADGSHEPDQGFWRMTIFTTSMTSTNFGQPAGRHGGQCNLGWLDGHCSQVKVFDQSNVFLQKPFDVATSVDNLAR